MKLKFKIKTILIIFVSLILGYSFASYSFKASKEKITNVEKIEEQKPPDSLITFETRKGKIDILITPDSVYFQPFEIVDTPFKSMRVKKEDYPKLFSQGVANQSFIRAEIQENEDKFLIVLSNNQPDHGVYSVTYSLLIDPITEEIGELSDLMIKKN